jgi:hypothetical protein
MERERFTQGRVESITPQACRKFYYILSYSFFVILNAQTMDCHIHGLNSPLKDLQGNMGGIHLTTTQTKLGQARERPGLAAGGRGTWWYEGKWFVTSVMLLFPYWEKAKNTISGWFPQHFLCSWAATHLY